MRYFQSPVIYEQKTGKIFTVKCPSIKKPSVKEMILGKRLYWPKWADLVKCENKLYWVNAKDDETNNDETLGG